MAEKNLFWQKLTSFLDHYRTSDGRFAINELVTLARHIVDRDPEMANTLTIAMLVETRNFPEWGLLLGYLRGETNTLEDWQLFRELLLVCEGSDRLGVAPRTRDFFYHLAA